MMWNSSQNVFALVGRILMAFLFIPAGFGKISGFAGAVGYAGAMGMPMPTVAVGIGLLIELVGGVALLLGWGTRWAALVLAFFTLVASFFFHAYWGCRPIRRACSNCCSTRTWQWWVGCWPLPPSVRAPSVWMAVAVPCKLCCAMPPCGGVDYLPKAPSGRLLVVWAAAPKAC
jgi:putative oxidoreductase